MSAWDNAESIAEVVALIEEYGWFGQHVLPDTPLGKVRFSYSIGFTAMNHPEIVITGLPHRVAHSFINFIGAEIRKGKKFVSGSWTDEFTEGGRVCFIRAEDTSGLGGVDAVYGEIDAVQMIWPDSAGRLPWHEGYNNPASTQPFLGPLPRTWVAAPWMRDQRPEIRLAERHT